MLVQDALTPQTLLLLRFLPDDMLVGIAHTLTLVRFWRPVTADVCSNLTDLLLIYAFNQNFRLAWSFNSDTFRHFVINRMGKTQRQVELAPLSLGTITNPHQLKLALEALGCS
jgi:hypothetical protein